MKCFVYGVLFIMCVKGFELPEVCKVDQYFEPGALICRSCPVNASMVPSVDGFGCSCAEHSIPTGVTRCRPCNATEVVSADGTMCVPRRCQVVAGKCVCRKCPSDYISVTQNFDGSPMKEVQCVKCARGYKAQANTCVRCDACTCNKEQIVIRDLCIPKSFVNKRPKYEEMVLHPTTLLDVVKNEYLCVQNDTRACRVLANECVKNFYTVHVAGPCRLWVQPKLELSIALPQLTVDVKTYNRNSGVILPYGKDKLVIAVAVHTSNGGFKYHRDIKQKIMPCYLPIEIKIGVDYSFDCETNVTVISLSELNGTLAPYLLMDGEPKPLPVSLIKPNGHNVERGSWPTNQFKRYFVVHNAVSVAANVTNTVYLHTLTFRLRIERDKYSLGGLRVHLDIEARYSSTLSPAGAVTTTLKVEHDMPGAGLFRALEIWASVLGVILLLYAMVQYRSVVRRGGLYVSAVPILSGAIADVLFFFFPAGLPPPLIAVLILSFFVCFVWESVQSAWLSTLHAMAAELSTFGLTLPLARQEENLIKAFIYTAVSLKLVKVVWVNVIQCRCDVFFLDWSEYNSHWKDTTCDTSNSWKLKTLAREWISMQTKRRVSPGYVVPLALLILRIMDPWYSYFPTSDGYRWAIATIAWWSSYITVLLARWLLDRFLGSPDSMLPKICAGVGVSLLVFQEELYAHYVHGRNDHSKDTRSIVGQQSTCRIVCSPQLRAVYKQLTTSEAGHLGLNETKQTLLSKFFAAFFERALDGLSWVASERTILEKLFDIELTTRESGNTSTLLYDRNEPSCFAVTWWGEEWTLSTFDAMVFSCVIIAANDVLLAALTALALWQIMKFPRKFFGERNLKQCIEVEVK